MRCIAPTLTVQNDGSRGQLHDDVILTQLPESFSLLFSCAHKGLTNLNKRAKTK